MSVRASPKTVYDTSVLQPSLRLYQNRQSPMTRVYGITARDLMKTPLFIAACKAAGVEVTKRQASKFNRGIGAAFAARERLA